MKTHWMRMLRWALGLALWASFTCAHAAQSEVCRFSNLVLNPPAPAQIVVAPSVAAGTIIYSTTFAATFQCSQLTAGDGVWFLTVPGLVGGGHPVTGMTNVSVTADGSGTPRGPGFGFISGMTGPCKYDGYHPGDRMPTISFTSSTGTCQGTVGLALSFYATTTGPVSGTIPADLSVSGGTAGVHGWMISFWNNTASVDPASSITGPSIPLKTLTSTCALVSSSNQTVNLPTVSTGALHGVGSTAGSTQFSITYNCNNAGGSMALSMLWTFTAPGTSPSDYALIWNGGTASGLAVQIVDSAGTAIVTGQPSQKFASVANGTNTITYYARYYQNAAIVNPGMVNATAQFTATYN